MRSLIVLSIYLVAIATAMAAPLFESELIFDPKAVSHGHVHASSVVACPNGDLLAVWYESGDPLPEPYFSKEHDKSDDVRIGASRKKHGQSAWDKPFVIADTFGVSDNNPCMVVDRSNRLWLVYATLLAVPQSAWGSSLLQYKVSSDFQSPGIPHWSTENVLPVHAPGIVDMLKDDLRRRAKESNWPDSTLEDTLKRVDERTKDPFKMRLGWMPRAHPLVRSDGAVILPLANENLGVAVMAITKDAGATWTYSSPVPGVGLEQPTLVEFPDHAMKAYFRNSGPEHRIKQSESHDGGVTWAPVSLTELPHPGAGIEALLLSDGALAMIYNDKVDNRDRLAVSVSTDRGVTWKWTKHIEDTPGGRFDYPSIIQAKDGTLHATYSFNTSTIKHVHFSEDWVRAN